MWQPCHRLGVGTSGLLLCAVGAKARGALSRRLGRPAQMAYHREASRRFRRPGSRCAGVARAAARSRGGPLDVAELPCPRGASARPHGPSHGLWQRWEPPRARLALSEPKLAA